jgi:hypothetical protein
VFILGSLFVACSADAPVDLDAERAALLALHEQILTSHRTDDVDGWLALEADTLLTGNRGDLEYSNKAERAEGRRQYLAATEFTVYRDMQPPVARVSADGSLGWVFAQVEIVGERVAATDTIAIHDVWTWIELYARRPEGWRLVGNVSTAKP